MAVNGSPVPSAPLEFFLLSSSLSSTHVQDHGRASQSCLPRTYRAPVD